MFEGICVHSSVPAEVVPWQSLTAVYQLKWFHSSP